MSGIKSTSAGTPSAPVDNAKGASTTQQQVAPVAPSSPSGGQSGPAIPQASSISQLTEGAVISAIVTARATSGDTMLHAEIGNFRMSAGGQLPVGSHVILEVEAFDEVILARIISLNGEKLASPPSVTLLPTISATKAVAEGYGNPTNLAPSEIKTGLQNLTTALAQAPKNTAQSSVVPPGNLPNTPPTSAIQSPSRTTFQAGQRNAQYGNTSVPIPSVGLQGSTPSSGQSPLTGTAAYTHTKSPGPKLLTSLPIMTGKTGMTTGADRTAAPLPPLIDPLNKAGSPELIKATIQRPPISQTIELGATSRNVQAGSHVTLIVSSATVKETLQMHGTTTTGTVIANSGSAAAVAKSGPVTIHVQTAAFGTLSYSTLSPPQVGSHMSFLGIDELQNFPLTSSPLISSAFKSPHLPILIEWDSLRSAMNSLLAIDPAQAVNIMNKRIPSPNSRLGASLLFFLSALNGGSLDQWLGQDFRRSLEGAGQLGLLANLDDEFATLARLHSETGGSDWKNLTFPFFDGETLRQVKMFYRQRNKDPQQQDEESTRFVIELDLSKSGPVQLDGLFSKARFDLVFRSQLPLPEDLRQNVLGIFTENLEITGIQGNLIFQRTVPFPIHPTEEWENKDPGFLEA